MRLTCKTKRGKGTIRQDVNVSIAEGARCEVKGCQELELIGTIVEKEVERQVDLIELKKKLHEKYNPKGNKKTVEIEKEIFFEMKELTHAFTNTECKFIKNRKVFGIKIKNAKGLLGFKVGAKRFGSELSAYAKASGVSGIIHLDELPNYGISEKEIHEVKKELNCGEEDNFVLIVAEEERAKKAFEAIQERFLKAFEGVQKETRGACEDGSSEYQRPLAGEARMYPETDIPAKEITEKYLNEIKKNLPKSVAKREALYAEWGLSTNHIEEMKLSNYARFFETCVEKGANAKVLASLLLQTLTELKRNNVPIEKVPLEQIKELALLEAKGKISKNNLGEAVIELSRGKTIEEALNAKKTIEVNAKTIEKKIAEIVSKNSELVKAKGLGAMGALMGDLMKEPELKGADGKTLSELLKKEIMARK
jgi:glutamyl-tRNA(Gln) amidotransferase subunit E